MSGPGASVGLRRPGDMHISHSIVKRSIGTRPMVSAFGVMLLLGLVAAGPAEAQEITSRDFGGEVFPGSEVEAYLRMLQLTGDVERGIWALRGFSPTERDRLLSSIERSPWAEELSVDSTAPVRIHRAGLGAVYNSSFPFGGNDGAIWTGRGLTSVATGGLSYRRGIVSATLAPTLIYTQNQAFELLDHTQTGAGDFRDGRQPGFIDLPQRFGIAGSVALDPGESSLRIDTHGVALGVATGNQYWGPGVDNPLVLGHNAPGYPQAFLGTSGPAGTPIGDIHARLFWGRLSQSSYSPVEVADSANRFATGLGIVFSPRGVPGLEIGGARFFQTPWTPGDIGFDDLIKTFEGFLKAGIPGKDVIPDENEPDRPFDPDNQIASVFARWVLPASRLELYGELARDDHSWDARDLALEPEHSSAYTLGLARVWDVGSRSLLQVRAEFLDSQITYLDYVRPQAPLYIHGWTRQGHTNEGQLLASSAAYGGSAAVVDADLYHSDGRVGLRWSRELRQTSDRMWLGEEVDLEGVDSFHSLQLDGLIFHGAWAIDFATAAVYNFNRNFGGDALNLHGAIGLSRKF